jgi:hypothetical protein
MSIVPTGRDNGLPPAASYVALVDVDPPIADKVLELLYEAGIPAVAEPLAGPTGPYQDQRPPSRPTDRVHVDREHRELARAVVARSLPTLRMDFRADAARRLDAAQMRDAEVDQEFRAIVSSYDDPVPGPVARWPVLEDRDPDAEPDPGPAPPPRGSGLSSRLVRRASEPAEEPDPSYWPEEHYVPPAPPPLPSLDRVARFAWLGVVGGPLLLLVGAVFNLGLDRWVTLTALAGFIAGFATLVARMPDRSADDDGDDGAVV